MRRKIISATLIALGYLLSPLSWWNDLLVNIPLAYLGGSLFGLLDQRLFFPGMVVSYWLTNLLGFALMHFGWLNLKKDSPIGRKEILQNVFFSLAYTLLMVFLVSFGVLKFPAEYFGK
ncbi:MAG: hypothetical protein UT24_C0032G0010 [Candidatus Woesebacteria bacterium GW2011_GWB1_39_12]|uniref:Uncharacterized protein n=1 Tax=Candidatus Woesebacteria bacterium GW2011_GWB1_39_12 TaxID=1618574 RepID=A0A0G0MEV9_9BACT|nr:MAG: hypothetical protein UT24_C0032G0010 [Candidatus Woesebacteria bacterium GW2011_GWB1_39_12]